LFLAEIWKLRCCTSVEKLQGIEDGMGPMWNLSFLEVVGQQEEEEDGKKKRKKTKGV
jgi:hypothetical protein